MKSPTRPTSDDYAAPYGRYVALAPEEDILDVLEQQSSITQQLLASVDEAKGSFRYAEGKWSVKQVIGHFIDSERIFAYRALAIARGEQQPLPGFEENEYVEHADFDRWTVGDLAEHYALVRRSTVVLMRNFSEQAWDRRGVASGHPIAVRAFPWIIVGHERHHGKVLRERYLL